MPGAFERAQKGGSYPCDMNLAVVLLGIVLLLLVAFVIVACIRPRDLVRVAVRAGAVHLSLDVEPPELSGRRSPTRDVERVDERVADELTSDARGTPAESEDGSPA